MLFPNIGIVATGTCRFIEAFYRLKTMPMDIQKKVEQLLNGPTNTYIFLGEILIFTKRAEEEHWEALKVSKKLDITNVLSKMEKDILQLEEAEGLRFQLSQMGIKP